MIDHHIYIDDLAVYPSLGVEAYAHVGIAHRGVRTGELGWVVDASECKSTSMLFACIFSEITAMHLQNICSALANQKNLLSDKRCRRRAQVAVATLTGVSHVLSHTTRGVATPLRQMTKLTTVERHLPHRMAKHITSQIPR